MKIKICGIKELDEINYINKIECDYVGFVFSESKRKVSITTCKKLVENLDFRIKRVGIFKNESLKFILEASESCCIDIIQLHGDESLEFINKLKGKCVWKAIKANEFLYKNIKIYNNKVDKIIIDANIAGSGKTFDWNMLKLLESEKFIIAGGICENNLEELIKFYRPYAIDLSSSVELSGKKDLNKLLSLKEKFDEVNI